MHDNDNLDWNASIENDGSGDFPLLPPGEYDFKVVDFEKQHSNVSKAPMAKVTLEVRHGDTTAKIFDYLVLTKKAEWKLSCFFRCIGLKKHGEPFVMQWNRVVGATGRAKLNIEAYTKKNGTAAESNKVQQYMDPPAPGTSTPTMPTMPTMPTAPMTPPAALPPPVSYVNSPNEDDDGLI